MSNQLFITKEEFDRILNLYGFELSVDLIEKIARISESNAFIATKLIKAGAKVDEYEEKTQNT